MIQRRNLLVIVTVANKDRSLAVFGESGERQERQIRHLTDQSVFLNVQILCLLVQ